MNFIDIHLGDYAADVAHLSLIEEGVYWRLLRRYFKKELPLPAELREVCRLAGARTRSEKQAVADVLGEFFVLQEDGWHNGRADREIAEYQAGEPGREERRTNKEERERRHRDERARLFEQLRGRGIHLPWNVGIEVLRSEVAKHCMPDGVAGSAHAVAAATPATGPVTQPATAPSTPATATQSPPPTTQIDDDERASAGGTVDKSGAQPFDDPSAPQTVSEWAAFFADEQSTPNAGTSDEFAELSRRWIAAGVTRGRMRQACARARALATAPISCLWSYVASVLATLDAPVRLPSTAPPGSLRADNVRAITVPSKEPEKTQKLLADYAFTPADKASKPERAAELRAVRQQVASRAVGGGAA